MKQVVRLLSDTQKAHAIALVQSASSDMVMTLAPAKRSSEQNSKLWAMLTDISSQTKLNGEYKTSEKWKLAFMHALGHEIKFEMGLNGEFFPLGYSTSKLDKKQFADLITFIQAYADENGIKLNE